MQKLAPLLALTICLCSAFFINSENYQFRGSSPPVLRKNKYCSLPSHTNKSSNYLLQETACLSITVISSHRIAAIRMNLLSRVTKTIRAPAFSFTRKMTKLNFDTDRPLIKLNETEKKVTTLLKDYVSWRNDSITDLSKKLELRITGGWVRDRLLGNESNDLDIAINCQTGEEFADGLRDFLGSKFEKYGVIPSNIHKIEKNPEKSKHLETATTKIYGLDIDFVNLRSEEYTEESRIPVIKFGTPEDDALRRDATLNALFYNIQNDTVEDFTGSGLQDLADGILRTPLAPLQTFLDDPLRVLRLVRFASRFNFKIADETLEAIKNEKIKEALLYKISRERVGVEIEKTLSGPNPVYGLQLLAETGLYESVFNFGGFQDAVLQLNDHAEIVKVFEMVDSTTLAAVEDVKSTDYSTSKISRVISNVLSDKSLKKLFWMSIVLRPWSSIKIAHNIRRPESKSAASDLIIREGLKYSKSDAQIISRILSSKDQYQSIVLAIPDYRRSELGLMLKQYEDNFSLSLVINLFDELIETGCYESVISKYEQFYEIVHRENLHNSYQLKPIIDGKTLAKELSRKPGPWMSVIIEKILVWQLDNPQLGQRECIEYVKSIIDDN